MKLLIRMQHTDTVLRENALDIIVAQHTNVSTETTEYMHMQTKTDVITVYYM